MLCVSISKNSVASILKSFACAELFEIRLDFGQFSEDEIIEIFSHGDVQKIATYRPGKVDETVRQKMLIAAIVAGADYVDLEIENSAEFNTPIVTAAKEHGTTVIISYHNYEITPTNRALVETIELCNAAGADIVKLACQANSHTDSARLLSLYQRDEDLVVLGMGEYGRITRVASIDLGAPFTFVAQDNAAATAPGQFSYSAMRSILHEIREGQ